MTELQFKELNTVVSVDETAAEVVSLNTEFAKRVLCAFSDFYNGMYDGLITTSVPYSDMVDIADAFIMSNNDTVQHLIKTLVDCRCDVFSSDREVVALMLALQVMGIVSYPRHVTFA